MRLLFHTMRIMPKLPYQYVARHVEELYEKHIHTADETEINKSCELISSFIKACGWDEDELLRMMHTADSPLLYKELNKLN
jgi:hypothetical protein